MSYTDFVYDPFMASLTVKKIGKAKDILTLRDITTTPKTENQKTYDLLKTKQTFKNKQQSFCTSDDDMWNSNLVSIRGDDYHWYNFPQYYNCRLEGNKSCSFGTIEGKCKGSCNRGVIFGEQINNADTADWGFYNNKNGRPDGDNTWAWINCIYTYDFSTYDTSQQAKIIEWIKQVYDTIKTKIPKNIWIGPLGNTNDLVNKWAAYNYYNNGQEYSDLNQAKRVAEEAGTGANAIMTNNEGTKFQIRIGSAVEFPDDAHFGPRVYNKKINPDVNIIDLFRVSNIIYAPITDIFNMMYETGYYKEKNELNSFRNSCKYLRANAFRDWKESYLTFWTTSTGILYSDSVTPPKIKEALNQIIDLPNVEKKVVNGFDTFTISLTLSYSQLQNYQRSDNKDLYISDLLTALFRDREATMLLNRNPVDIATPSVVDSKIDFYTIINLDTFRLETKFPNQFPVPNTKDFFTTAQITATVSQWSPMTVLYFATKGITFSSVMGEEIYTNCKIYPLSAYEEECSAELLPECIDKIRRFCPTIYIPPSSIGDINLTTEYLFSSDNGNCFCVMSGVAPATEIESGNLPAMCFDKNCSEELKKAFRLNDNTCKQYCEKVYNWRTDKTNSSRNPASFDPNVYNRICGSSYSPLYSQELNLRVLTVGIVITLLATLVLFLYTRQSSVFWSIGLFLFLSGLTAFLTYDLGGKSQCDFDKHKPVCTSRLTEISIPTQFCRANINCECAFNEDCGTRGCKCSSGVCVPFSGKRNVKTEESTYIDIPNFTLILVILLILPFLILKLFDNNIIRISLICLSILSLLGLLYLFSVKKKVEKVFDGPCVNCNCETNQTCCADSCCTGACLNGKCQNYISGCPMSSAPNTVIDIQTLSSGNYTLKYLYDGIEWLLSVENSRNNTPGAVILRPANPNFSFIWNYDARNNVISGQTKERQRVYMSASDIVNSSICGNLSPIYKGAPSALIIDEAYAKKFMISSTTIYSIDANAYIIPDTSFITQNDVNRGYLVDIPCITLTYTSDREKASVWNIMSS